MNWYEVAVQLPLDLQSWVANNVPADQVASVPAPHLTILYGFDPRHYDEIDQIVRAAKLDQATWTFGVPKERRCITSVARACAFGSTRRAILEALRSLSERAHPDRGPL